VILPTCLNSQTYQQFRLETLCGHYQDKQTLHLKNQPAVISLHSRLKKRIRCHLELRLPSDYFGFSIFTESLYMEDSQDCSKDFLQYGRDFIIFTSFKSEKICGIVQPPQMVYGDNGSLLGVNYGDTSFKEREYIEAEDDEMDVWIEIYPSDEDKPAKQVHLIVTPFKKVCTKNDFLYKQCPGSNKCIKRDLFCDGVINCDGDDEKDEHCFKDRVHPGSGFFQSIPVIIIIVLVCLVALMGTVMFCKVASSYLSIIKSTREDLSSPLDDFEISLPGRPSAPISQESSEVSAIGVVWPSAPLREEGPFMNPLPPSYHEVMAIDNRIPRDDPPKYSEFPD